MKLSGTHTPKAGLQQAQSSIVRFAHTLSDNAYALIAPSRQTVVIDSSCVHAAYGTRCHPGGSQSLLVPHQHWHQRCGYCYSPSRSLLCVTAQPRRLGAARLTRQAVSLRRQKTFLILGPANGVCPWNPRIRKMSVSSQSSGRDRALLAMRTAIVHAQ